MLIQLIYRSHSRIALTEEPLQALGTSCTQRNQQRQIFGVLLYDGAYFMQVLEGEGAVLKNREVMGATNPKDAAPGTIRAEFAESVGENSVHGSDAPETAAQEIAFFFAGMNIYSR